MALVFGMQGARIMRNKVIQPVIFGMIRWGTDFVVLRLLVLFFFLMLKHGLPLV